MIGFDMSALAVRKLELSEYCGTVLSLVSIGFETDSERQKKINKNLVSTCNLHDVSLKVVLELKTPGISGK